MMLLNFRALLLTSTPARARRVAAVAGVALVLAVALAASSQESAPANPAQPPAQTDAAQRPVTPQAKPDDSQQPATPAQTADQTPAQPDASQQPVTPQAKPDDSQQPATPAQTPAQPDAAPQSQNPATAPPSADNSAQPAASQDTSTQPAATPAANGQPEAPAAGKPAASAPGEPAQSASEEPGATTEDELKKMLIGKPLFLRNGYLFDQLSYNELGMLIGRSPHASYTLSAVQIDKVRLTKHKLELEGARYGLHFLGALATEDPATAMDRVKITPKKKTLKITIDREIVVKPKKEKPVKPAKTKPADAQVIQSKESIAKATATLAPVMPEPVPASDATATAAATPGAAGEPQGAEAPKQPADANASASPASTSAAAPEGAHPESAAQPEAADADQGKAEMAAAPKEERPADPNSVTFTLSPAHAAKILKKAINNVFATGLDDRMMASMPDFWKNYYQAAQAKTDFQPSDPAVMRQGTVDQKAKLTSKFEPASNQYAQDNGVAGMALYHVVIGPDGTPGEIAVARPIGFGLDENAVTAIQAAKFSPAIKDGKPVAVLLDLVVQFRIYSKRTSIIRIPGQEDNPAAPILPGPYTAHDLAVRRREELQKQSTSSN